MTYKEIYDETLTLDREDLSKLNNLLAGLIRARRQVRRVVAIGGFEVNDRVRWALRNRRLPHGVRGIVKEIKRTRMVVFFDGYGLWTIDPTCIEKIEQEAKA